eukprot:Protomagalhaensia_sp_Gyna_25__3351@NODE_3028_length_766_cov_2_928473_g2530_i0_p1_GENE_NODE_3028_length_766_cov_2_928473_g2530_i0NODE_3028_length_766_cov_2_928473_g2530_i0_p1_ORF_typecomplete_len218_score25_29Bac_export_2/PF01312_19/0_078DUF1687/PF07955_11/10DUF1687/PF07955_11/37DHHC/PF01529_20/1e03DHHC/PF01529_20/0_88_NODE_3028_length_766_cov_2_928473_g2530_i03656
MWPNLDCFNMAWIRHSRSLYTDVLTYQSTSILTLFVKPRMHHSGSVVAMSDKRLQLRLVRACLMAAAAAQLVLSVLALSQAAATPTPSIITPLLGFYALAGKNHLRFLLYNVTLVVWILFCVADLLAVSSIAGHTSGDVKISPHQALRRLQLILITLALNVIALFCAHKLQVTYAARLLERLERADQAELTASQLEPPQQFTLFVGHAAELQDDENF